MSKLASVQTFGKIPGAKSVAEKLLANGMNPDSLRTNAVLRYDEWKAIDEAIIPVARQRAQCVQDLISRGLTYNLDGMASTVLQHERVGDFTAASVAMTPRAGSEKDRATFDQVYLPLPFTFKDFEVDVRTLNASRKLGQPLDTTNAELATELVMEQVEQLLITGGSNINFGSGVLYGYLDFPQRNTDTTMPQWDASSTTAAEILAWVIEAKQSLISARHYGPYGIYIPTAYETVLDSDYSTSTSTVTTLRQRILAIDGIEFVRVSDFMTANNVVMVQMNSRTVRMVIGLQPTPLEWDDEGGLVTNYKIMTIMVPQLRADKNGRSGILHGSTS